MKVYLTISYVYTLQQYLLSALLIGQDVARKVNKAPFLILEKISFIMEINILITIINIIIYFVLFISFVKTSLFKIFLKLNF